MEDSSFKVEGRSVATVACLYERGNLYSLNKVWLACFYKIFYVVYESTQKKRRDVTQWVCTGNLETSRPEAVAFWTVPMDFWVIRCADLKHIS